MNAKIFTRSIFLVGFVMILTLVLFVSPRHTAQAQTWTLVWSDEFNGNSVDPNNWAFDTGGSGNGNHELEYYTSGQNASVANGILSITANQGSGRSAGQCRTASNRRRLDDARNDRDAPSRRPLRLLATNFWLPELPEQGSYLPCS